MRQLTVKTVITGFVGNHKTPHQLNNLYGRKEGRLYKICTLIAGHFLYRKKIFNYQQRSEKIVQRESIVIDKHLRHYHSLN